MKISIHDRQAESINWPSLSNSHETLKEIMAAIDLFSDREFESQRSPEIVVWKELALT